MGVLYEIGTYWHGKQIAVYERGKITDVSNIYNSRVIAKYYGNTVEEYFINSSKIIGHVSGSNGYLGMPKLTATSTPFIYADSCNRIYLYSTRKHVADFEGDATGALLAYMAYYCKGKAINTSQITEKDSRTNKNLHLKVEEPVKTSSESGEVGVPAATGPGCLIVSAVVLFICSFIMGSLYEWKNFISYFLCNEHSTISNESLLLYSLNIVAGIVAFIWNRVKGYTSFVKCYTITYLIVTVIAGIDAFFVERSSIMVALFGTPIVVFTVAWPIVLISFIITRIILASKK